MLKKTQIGIKTIKKIAAFLRYGTKETITLLVAVALFSSGTWLIKNKVEILKDYQPLIAGSFVFVAVLLAGWVVYRFVFRIALPKPIETKLLSHAIKGLMPFTQEDGELFYKLERENELTQLSS